MGYVAFSTVWVAFHCVQRRVHDEERNRSTSGLRTNVSSAGHIGSWPPGFPGPSRPALPPGTSAGRPQPRWSPAPARGPGGTVETHAGRRMNKKYEELDKKTTMFLHIIITDINKEGYNLNK